MKTSDKISLKLWLSILLSVGAMVGMLGLFCTTPAMGQNSQNVLAEITASANVKLVKSGNWTYELDEENQTATLVSYKVIENLNPEWIHHDIDPSMKENYGYGLKVEIPAVIDGVTVVGVGAKNSNESIFSECDNVTEITFAEGSSVKSINRFAFGELPWLRKVTIPTTVEVIDELAFAKSYKLTDIVVGENEHFSLVDGVLYNKDLSTLICYPAGKLDETFEVPTSVNTILGGAFGGAYNLASVVLPDSVKHVGDFAFMYTSFTEFSFPDSVETIGQGCFYNDDKLLSVTLPNNALFKSIEKSTFENCKKLSSIAIPSSVKTIGVDAFSMCRALKAVVIPSAVTRIEARAFNECVSLSSIEFLHTKLPENFIKPAAFLTRAIKPVVKLNSLKALDAMKTKYSACFTNAPACFEIKSTKVVIGDLTLYTKFGDTKDYHLDNLCTQVFSGKVKVAPQNSMEFNGYFTMPNAGGERVVDREGNLLVAVGSATKSVIELYPYYSTGTQEDWDYKIIDGEAHIIGYKGETKASCAIPAYIFDGTQEFKVVRVGYLNTAKKSMFNETDLDSEKDNSHIVSVTIPGTVKQVADYSFYKCSRLNLVSLGEGIEEIGDNAFYYNKSLKSIIFPSSCHTIGTLAFRGCVALENVEFSEGLSTIKNYAFFSCDSLSKVVLPKSLSKLSTNAFGDCKNLQFIVTKTNENTLVSESDDGCFVIAKDAVSLDPTALTTDVKRFVVEEGNQAFKVKDGILYSSDGSTLIRCPTDIEGCVQIADGVTTIGDYAFNGCRNVTKVTIPVTVKTIGKWAFAWCDNLVNVVIPKSVSLLDDYAFKNSGILKLTFEEPNSGTLKIGCFVFEFCVNLKDITLPNTLTSIGSYAFANCTKLHKIVLPDSITEISSGAFRNSGLVNVSLPKNKCFTEISFNTFGFCKSLTKVYIPANVTSVGDYAFAWTSKLYQVEAASAKTKYAQTAFNTSIKGKDVKIVVA